MSTIHVSRWIERGRRVLRLLGTFDGEGAARLVEEVRRAGERELVIDVRRVSGLDEVAVAALARLAGAGRRIAIRGLSARQHRALRDLGASLSAL